MRFANHAFLNSGDAHYKMLQKNPDKYFQRKIKEEIEPGLKDLISGLLKADPKERITMEQIKAHEWFQGSTASSQEVLDNHDELMNAGSDKFAAK